MPNRTIGDIIEDMDRDVKNLHKAIDEFIELKKQKPKLYEHITDDTKDN